jgi:uncharacterized protein
MAENIVAFRQENKHLKTENNLKKADLAKKPYQAAAFIIKDGKNPLDNSAVHPEAWNC